MINNLMIKLLLKMINILINVSNIKINIYCYTKSVFLLLFFLKMTQQ